MKVYKILLILAVFFIFVDAASAKKTEKPGDKVKTSGKNEVLVAKDIGKGKNSYLPRWCGNSALILIGDRTGVEYFNFITGKKIKIIEKGDDTDYNCFPDGRWLLFKKTNTIMKPGVYNYDTKSDLFRMELTKD